MCIYIKYPDGKSLIWLVENEGLIVDLFCLCIFALWRAAEPPSYTKNAHERDVYPYKGLILAQMVRLSGRGQKIMHSTPRFCGGIE